MLVRQTLLYLPAQFVGPVTQLVAAFIWTFWLTPQQLGSYALIWSIQELAGLATLTWWSAYVQRYASSFEGNDGRRAFDRTESLVQIAAAAIQTALAEAMIAVFFPDMATFELFAAIAAFTVIRNLAGHLALRARAQSEAAAYTANVVIGAAGGLALGLVGLQFLTPSLELLLWSYTLAQIVGLLVCWPLMRARVTAPTMRSDLLGGAWRFGWPVAVSSCFIWIGAHAIRFVVEAFSGRAAVGLMTVGWWLGLRLASTVGMMIMGAAYNVAVERMRQDGADAARHQLSVNATMLVGLLAPLCAGGWMLAEPLSAVLVEASYREMTAAILPAALIAGALRVFQDQCVDAGFLVFERPGFPAMVSAVDALTAVAGCIIGLYLGGVPGAAWGCAGAAIVTSAFGGGLAHKIYGFRLPAADVARIAVSVAAMIGALRFMEAGDTLPGLIALIATGAAVYGAAMLALSADLRRIVFRPLLRPR